MKGARTALMGLLVLALASCSGSTVVRVEADLAEAIPQDQASGELGLLRASVWIPEDPAGELVVLPEAKALVSGNLHLRIALENIGTRPAQIGLTLRLGGEGDSDLFDGQGDLSLGDATASLQPGESGSLTLDVAVEEGSQAAEVIRTGKFRVAARMDLSGEKVRYQVAEARLTLRARPASLLP